MKTRRLLWLKTMLWAVFLLSANVDNVYASTFTVNKLADTNDGTCDADCSLREAITAANANVNGNTVIFDLPDSGPHLIILTHSLWPQQAMTIVNDRVQDEAITLTFDGVQDRHFLSEQALTIAGLILKNGAAGFKDGGSIYSRDSLVVRNCRFENNQVSPQMGQGGAIYSLESAWISNSHFKNNSAWRGGAVKAHNLTLQNCVFESNTATNGGAVFADSGSLMSQGSSFINNSASFTGGAIHGSYSNNTLVSCTFSGNRAGSYGNAIYTQNNYGGSFQTNTRVYDCTFQRNDALNNPTGYAFYTETSTTRIKNSIFDESSDSYTLYSINGALLSDGFNLSRENTPFLKTATDKTGVDPRLVSGGPQMNGGFAPTIALMMDSPALDAGDSFETTDQRGSARTFDNPVINNATGGDGSDIGAYERQAAPPRLFLNNVELDEVNNGTTYALFTVTLDAPSDKTITVNALPANGTAKAPDDYTSGGATLSFAPGETVKTFNVPVKGDLLDETDETFFVILSSPVGASIGRGRGLATITDDDATPSISIDDVSVKEYNSGQTTAVFRLKLSAPSGQLVRVSYATANGTATAGSDYVAIAPTSVAFNTGSLYAYARVLINGDLLNESNETFSVNLSSPINAAITDIQAIGTILNDDSAPSLTINDVSITEGNTGTKNLTFTATLSKASGQTVTVNYATADGIARSGSDYEAENGILRFLPDTGLTRQVSITINGDVAVEGNETLFVLLSNATNASIARGRGVGTISNDDNSG